jgi:hypothetical protein
MKVVTTNEICYFLMTLEIYYLLFDKVVIHILKEENVDIPKHDVARTIHFMEISRKQTQPEQHLDRLNLFRERSRFRMFLQESMLLAR